LAPAPSWLVPQAALKGEGDGDGDGGTAAGNYPRAIRRRGTAAPLRARRTGHFDQNSEAARRATAAEESPRAARWACGVSGGSAEPTRPSTPSGWKPTGRPAAKIAQQVASLLPDALAKPVMEKVGVDRAIVHPATAGGAEEETQGPCAIRGGRQLRSSRALAQPVLEKGWPTADQDFGIRGAA